MNGRVQSGKDGSGVAGVTVSDGRAVVGTNAEGRFELDPWGPFVFVTRPTGWSCVEWFRRIPDPGEVIFTLEPQEQSTPFSFVHISDIHVTAHQVDLAGGPATRMANLTDAVEVARFLSSIAAQGDIAFVAATGDLTNHGLPEELDAFRKVVDQAGVPVVVAPGNHDHMNGDHDFTLSRHDYLVNQADPSGYEAAFGPRWYSFDHAGTHFVVIDWHTHELGLDHDVQDQWLRADLARTDPTTPWILLTHDQFPGAFFEPLPRRPVATFSGHWHTSRVVEVDGTLHVNTPNTFFAGLDYSPPSTRTATVDARGGVRLSTESNAAHPLPGSDPADIAWSTQLAGSVLRSAPVAAGDCILVTSHDDDHARGALTCLDAATGSVLWARDDMPPLKASPLVVDDAVVVLDVLGDLHCVALDDGAPRWIDATDDPLRHWGYTRPATDGTTVFAGDQRCFRAVDLDTGVRRWLRDDLSFHMNLVSHASPLVHDDTVIVGFWPLPPALQSLAIADGSSVVATTPAAGSLAGGFAGPSPVGDLILSSDNTLVFLPSGAGTFALDATTLETRWQAPATGLYNPAAPVETRHGLAVVIAEEGLHMLDPDTGAVRWKLELSGNAGPYACYGRSGHALLSDPAVLGVDHLLLAGIDGQLRVVAAADGAIVATRSIEGNTTSTPLIVDGDAIVATTDGVVRRVTGLACA